MVAPFKKTPNDLNYWIFKGKFYQRIFMANLEAGMAASKEEIPEFSITTEGKKGNAVRLTISGHLGLDNLLSFQSELENFLSRMEPASLTVDLAGVEVLRQCRRACSAGS